MPNFAIMRVKKIKSAGSLFRASKHNTREKLPPNADPTKSKNNLLIESKTTADLMDSYRQKLPQKIRKDAVHALEFVFTASKKSLKNEDWDKYFRNCCDWISNNFGGRKNVLQVALHQDEETPHIHVLMMPLKDDKLNAKYFVGGHRDRMSELQNKFFNDVGKKYNLERGRSAKETKVKHTRPSLAYLAEELRREKVLLLEKSKNLDEREKKISTFEKDLRAEQLVESLAAVKTSEQIKFIREAAINLMQEKQKKQQKKDKLL